MKHLENGAFCKGWMIQKLWVQITQPFENKRLNICKQHKTPLPLWTLGNYKWDDSTYETCVFMEEEWKEMAKSHVCMDGNGFWQAQKRYNLHKAYIGHMVLQFHNSALPFKCKYTAKCLEINLLITSMMSSGEFIESFILVYPRPKSPYTNWIWKRAFGNHICLKVKTPNINLSLLSIYIGLVHQKLCSPFSWKINQASKSF